MHLAPQPEVQTSQSTLAPVNISNPQPKEMCGFVAEHDEQTVAFRPVSLWWCCCCVQGAAGLDRAGWAVPWAQAASETAAAAAAKSWCCCYRGDSQRDHKRACVCVWGGGLRKEKWGEHQEQAFSGLFYKQSDGFILLYPAMLQFPIAQMGNGNGFNSSSVQKKKTPFDYVYCTFPFINRTP